MANKPIIPFNPNGPVLSGSNDTSDTKPYVGKPKPMPPTTRPPGMGYSPSGGSFDASSLRRAPRPTMILPGQGQGPMPVGTKPLPTPNVNQKPNSSGGGLEDWIKNHPNGQIYDEGPWGGGRPKADMGDNRLYRDPSTQPGNPEFRNFRGDLGGKGSGAGYQQPPWLEGRMLPMDIGPGSANERAQAALKAEWEAKNGPWQGGGMGVHRWDGQGVDTGFSGGGQIGFNNDPRYGGGMGVHRWDGSGFDTGFSGGGYGTSMGSLSPDGKGGYLTPDGRTVQIPNYGGMMKPPAMPGGESVAPGMGMPTQYGGGPSGRGGVEVPYDGMNGAVQRGPGAPGMPSGGKPPQGQQPGMPSQGGGRQPLRPGMEYRPGGGQRPQRPQQGGGANPQAMQQGAQALYSDNTIPHEFKGQLLQAAQSGNAQAFNEMLFNSGIPHETKLRLQQMFGYGSGAGAAPQAATPDQGQNQVQQSYNGGKGSPYYGAF